MPDTKATVECLYRQDGCNSQSGVHRKSLIQFYCGYLQSEYAGDFLPKILGETLEAILSMSGTHRASCFSSRQSSKTSAIISLASDTDIDAQTYQQMREKAIGRCCGRMGRSRSRRFCGSKIGSEFTEKGSLQVKKLASCLLKSTALLHPVPS